MLRFPILLVAVVAAGPFVADCSGGALAAGPAPEDVLRRIPARVVGFVVVPRLERTAGRVDAFVKAISPPDEPLLPVPLLELVKARFGIGEGFDPRGGFAVMVLDGQGDGREWPVRQARPVGQKRLEDVSEGIPIVALIPGTGPGRMFALRKPRTVGGVVQFAGEDGKPRYCLQVGGYVALGPNLKAVQAVAASNRSMLQRLGKSEKAFIKDRDLSIWLDVAKAGPALRGAVPRWVPGGRDRAGPVVAWGQYLRQMQSALVGLRFNQTGLVVDGRGTFSPDSRWGKILADYEPVQPKLLQRLPGGPYVLALGVLNAPKPPAELRGRHIDRVLTAEPLSQLSESMQALYRRTMLALGEQVESAALWVGQAGRDGSAAIQVVCVLRCASAAGTRKLLADLARVVEAVVNLRRDRTGSKPVCIRYLSRAVSVAGRKADAITVSLAEQAGGSGGGSAALFGPGVGGKAAALFGPGEVRLLVCQVDDKTLLVTLGVGDDLPVRALRAAQQTPKAEVEGKGLLADAAVRKALSALPAKHTAVAVINLRRLQELVRAAGARAVAGKNVLTKQDVPSDVPVAVGIWVEGSAIGFSAAVPTETVKAVVKVVSAALAQQVEVP